ncbi:MAG: exodeoxyribonuclease VII small subunit [Candidatus Acetothermia bacterium]
MNKDENRELDIAEGLDRLEEIVEGMEEEGLDLDQSLNLFSEGVQLADSIKDKLEESEDRLKKVIEDSEGSFSWEDLDI